MEQAPGGSRRFLVVTWDGGGNAVPAVGIGDALAARGHEVTLIGHRSLAPRAESRGLAFRALERAPEWTAGLSLEEQLPAFAGLLSGLEIAEEAADVIEHVGADALVVDCMLAGALAAGERSNVPTAALVHLLYHVLTESFSWMMPAVNETRSALGLAPVAAYTDLLEATALLLVTTIEELDLPLARVPGNLRYVGPVFDEGPRAPDLDLPADERPLVLVSFSSTYQHQEEPLQRVAEALGELPLRGLITLGDTLAPDVLSSPPNVAVRAFARHAEVLPSASLVVTHAGLWTVMAALAQGVPLVCMPMGRDQDTNARRVEALGAGIRLGVDADVQAIRHAVDEVLGTPSYREAAGRLRATIASAPGADGAAAELERLCA